MSKQSLLFTYWLLRHTTFWFTPFHKQCSTCVIYRTPCHSNGRQVLPNQLLRSEAEDFFGGGRHPKHMPWLTCVAWLQPIINNSKLIFKQIKIKNALLAVKALTKSRNILAALINSHFNQFSIMLASFNQLPKIVIKNWSLRKYISVLLFHKYNFKFFPQKIYFWIALLQIHFKIAPSKNAVQNCYHKDVFY